VTQNLFFRFLEIYFKFIFTNFNFLILIFIILIFSFKLLNQLFIKSIVNIFFQIIKNLL